MKLKIAFLVLLASAFGMSSAECPNAGASADSACQDGQPNPAVDRIDFALVTQTSDTTGTVRITGVIENKGSGDFMSGQGQQTVQLYEGVNVVSEQEFENLAAGDTLSVSYTRDWNTNNEFPPTYRVLIIYDPDVYIDGNPANNDCQTSDNALLRDGEEINDEFPDAI